MKSTLSIILSVMAIAIATAQQMTFSLEPQTPVASDNVQLTISQIFNNTCYATTAAFEKVGNTINVDVTTVAEGEICLLVLTPQSATIDLGTLAPGTYQVNVTWTGAPKSGSPSATYSFDVTASAPPLRLFMGEPISLRFESALATNYQVRWSRDLESWTNLGGKIAGTGGEIVVHDITEPGPARFYQLKLVTEDDPVPQLEVTIVGDTLSCQLANIPVDSDGHWILQSSSDLSTWEDLLFFNPDGEAVVAIPPGRQEFHFLRARRIENDDPVLRSFLSARNTWRGAGIDHYSFEASWGSSWFFWRGTVTVQNNTIISVVPIETNYPETPAQRTIDGWLAHLGSFLDPRAAQINATYDPDFGFPASAYIDIDPWIADEEQSWSLRNFQPLP